MQCPECQYENPLGQKFCGQCGTRLAARCPGCGASNPPGQKFCGECGTSLTSAQTGLKFGSPETYTPKHLAEKILTSRSALEGERKQVTVLFADLKGSMELLADRDPEEARKLLDPVLERMMEAVHHYEGTVNQVMGDGIMALFGAPLAHEDHAVRACYAALRMQESVKRYAEEIHRTEGVPIQIRVGLNSGEVVVRSIGSDLHMDYTAVGQTTHLAARMEQMAMPGSILMPAYTLRLAEDYVQVKALGLRPVKGLAAPVEVYEIVGGGTVRLRLKAAAIRGLTRFVGREREVEQLRMALGQATAGHGQVAAVVGEPGVGKSRLYWEFTHSHRTEGWLIVESGTVSYGKASPYLPVIELLRAYFQIEARDDARKIREKVTGKLVSLDRALEPALPALLGLLDVPVEDAEWQRLEPSQRRQRTLDGVKRLLLRESQVQPLIVMLEDLHWIDTETQALLDSLVESLPTARVLLLVSYRPEYQHTWGQKGHYLQLRIDPLPPESAEELLKALLGENRALEPLKRLLIERTEGNPFFLEESVRTLVENQMLVGERGAYRMAKTPETWQIPATAQAILAARIDRLPPEDKRLLQAASVIGKDVPFALLEVIVEVPEDDLQRGLAHLMAAEFLYETSVFPELEYTFKHALTHEVAYTSILQERRRALHTRIVEAIEQLYADRLAEQYERLAHHALYGEAWKKAFMYLREAGAKSFGRSAYAQAATSFEQALEALKHLPESRETLAHAFDLTIEIRRALFPLGKPDRIFACLREAEALALALGDQRRLASATWFMGNHFWWTGRPDRQRECAERALALCKAEGDLPAEHLAYWGLGQAFHALGDYRRAIDALTPAVQYFSADRVGERLGNTGFPSVFTRHYVAWCFTEHGEISQATAYVEDAVRIAEALDNPLSLAQAYWQLGNLSLFRRDLESAIPALERVIQIYRSTNLSIWLPWAAAALGSAYALSGRLADAMPLFEQAIEEANSSQFMFGQALRVAWLSEAHLVAHRIDHATPLAEQALSLSREHRERGHEAWALRLLGEVASHRDPPDVEAAEAYYRDAGTLADELGMRPLVAHSHLGLGKLYRGSGDHANAKEHLTTAATLYREMDMGFWLEKAEAELGPLQRPHSEPEQPAGLAT
jgi:class 3 adenylate cyclase/tetratricopeptide (TPR) repeat protein